MADVSGARAETRGQKTFGRDRRVRKRREFVHVQGAARRVTTPHFVLLIAARAPLVGGSAAGTSDRDAKENATGPARIGFIVTRKVGVAVVRNRIRRVCRECFRQWPGLLPDGVDLVVVARDGAETLGLAGVRAEWGSVSGLLRRRAEEALARRGGATHLSGGHRRTP